MLIEQDARTAATGCGVGQGVGNGVGSGVGGGVGSASTIRTIWRCTLPPPGQVLYPLAVRALFSLLAETCKRTGEAQASAALGTPLMMPVVGPMLRPVPGGRPCTPKIRGAPSGSAKCICT